MREWVIGYIVSHDGRKAASIAEHLQPWPDQSETIHVVEKSAYDALLKEMTAYRTLKAIASDISEKVALEDENDKLLAALKAIRWSWENDAGRNCDNIAYEAIKEYEKNT